LQNKIIFILVVQGILCVASRVLSNAAEKIYLDQELKRIDDGIATLESETQAGILRTAPIEFINLFSGKGISLGIDLFIGNTQLVKSMSTQEREHYKSHPSEYQFVVISSELGEERVKRLGRIFKMRAVSKNEYVRREAMWWMTVMAPTKDNISEIEKLLRSND